MASNIDAVENKESIDVTVSAEGEDSAAKTAKDAKVIRYVGSATRRVISPEDWAKVKDIGGAKDETVWDFSNDFSVEAKDLTKAQIKYLLEVDGRFKGE